MSVISQTADSAILNAEQNGSIGARYKWTNFGKSGYSLPANVYVDLTVASQAWSGIYWGAGFNSSEPYLDSASSTTRVDVKDNHPKESSSTSLKTREASFRSESFRKITIKVPTNAITADGYIDIPCVDARCSGNSSVTRLSYRWPDQWGYTETHLGYLCSVRSTPYLSPQLPGQSEIYINYGKGSPASAPANGSVPVYPRVLNNRNADKAWTIDLVAKPLVDYSSWMGEINSYARDCLYGVRGGFAWTIDSPDAVLGVATDASISNKDKLVSVYANFNNSSLTDNNNSVTLGRSTIIKLSESNITPSNTSISPPYDNFETYAVADNYYLKVNWHYPRENWLSVDTGRERADVVNDDSGATADGENAIVSGDFTTIDQRLQDITLSDLFFQSGTGLIPNPTYQTLINAAHFVAESLQPQEVVRSVSLRDVFDDAMYDTWLTPYISVSGLPYQFTSLDEVKAAYRTGAAGQAYIRSWYHMDNLQWIRMEHLTNWTGEIYDNNGYNGQETKGVWTKTGQSGYAATFTSRYNGSSAMQPASSRFIAEPGER